MATTQFGSQRPVAQLTGPSLAAGLLPAGMAANPRVGLIGHLGQHEQVVAAKVARLLPHVAVLVQPGQRDVVPLTGLGLVPPDRGFDQPQPYFVDGWFRH